MSPVETLFRLPVETLFRFPVDTLFLSPVETLFRSAADTPADLSFTAGVCEVEGFVAALSLAAADWLPPFIDLFDVPVLADGVRSVVVVDRFCVEGWLFCVVVGRLWVVDGLFCVVDGRL